jgi:hypothetical protein
MTSAVSNRRSDNGSESISIAVAAIMDRYALNENQK